MLLDLESVLGLGGYDASAIEQYARPPVALQTQLLNRSAIRGGKAKASGAITDGMLPISQPPLNSGAISQVGAKPFGPLFFKRRTDNSGFPRVRAGNVTYFKQKKASSRDLTRDYIHHENMKILEIICDR